MAPLIIPIFLPAMGCLSRCLFCNQKASNEGLPSPASVRHFIEVSLAQIPDNKKNREKQVAFYGGSFTAIHREDQVRYLKEVQPFLASGLIDSLRISTRPDALDEKTLSLLKEYGVKTIEVGVQSMIDEVLSLAQRGHRAEDTISATLRLKQWAFEVGHQLMVGLPGDTCDRFLQTLDRVIELKPDFVRIHPTLVLRGAPLENLWREGRYSPLSIEETIDWLKRGLARLENSSISVARMGLQPTDELEGNCLAGPYHPALRQLVDGAVFFDMAMSLLQTSQKSGQALFFCHPKEISNLRGQKNENILKLKKHFNLSDIFIQGRQELPKGYLELQTQGEEVSTHRKSLGFQEETDNAELSGSLLSVPVTNYDLLASLICLLFSSSSVVHASSCSLIAARIVSTVGTLVSLPDSSLNSLQENPTNPWGCNSFPLIKTEGDPVTPRVIALVSSIL